MQSGQLVFRQSCIHFAFVFLSFHSDFRVLHQMVVTSAV
jgi:hypothetical protein